MLKVRLGGAVAAILLAGCHSFLPFGEPSSDRSDLPGDAAPTDGARETAQVPKLDARSCAGGSCGATNPDCDGLLDEDPYTAQCNPLLFEDSFSSPTGWQLTGSWNNTGGLSSTVPTQTATATHALPPSVTAPDYLVAARVRLGKVGNPGLWGIGVLARVSATTHISCDLWVNTSPSWGPPVASPDARVEVRSAAGLQSGWPQPPTSSLAGAEGTAYTLLLWYTERAYNFDGTTTCSGTPPCQSVLCRICPPAGKCTRQGPYAVWMNPQANLKYVPTSVGGVGLRTFGRTASFESIRVYGIKNP